MDDDDGSEGEMEAFINDQQKMNEKLTRMSKQRSILDDFANGFVPEEIFAQELQESLEQEKQKAMS